MLVIPAKAGIHLDLAFALYWKAQVKMDPSFRWDDDQREDDQREDDQREDEQREDEQSSYPPTVGSNAPNQEIRPTMTTSLNFIVAIPARYGASRLPGKPLQLLAGEPLVVHTARRALVAGAREVWVATDDERVAMALANSGVRIAMTAATHVSGTDRLAECAAIAGWSDDTVVINLQGDEPFAPPAGIRLVAQTLQASTAAMSTLATPIEDIATLLDPNSVKLVRAGNGDALYFSRAPIPWPRDAFAAERNALPEGEWLRHIGIYGYRAGFLRSFAAMPPGRLEQLESLEQLRVLEAGYRIAAALTPEAFPPGVDTADDLARAERYIGQRPCFGNDP